MALATVYAAGMDRREQLAAPRGLTFGLLFAAALWGGIAAAVALLRR